MKKRKWVSRNYRNKSIMLKLFLAVFLFMGIGYSILMTDLSLDGTIEVSKYDHSLYGVFEKAVNSGYAVEYIGSHQDSMDASKSTEKIYHWYADNDTKGTEILDKNNVIFADQCWQMIRTTDTGGVKMIYNGEAVDNQCLNTRGTHVGYASRTSQNLANNYWYGTDYTYDSTNQVFSISGTTEQTMWNESNGPGLVGKYTCMNASSVNDTCSTLYLVESYYNTTSAYVIPLDSNSNYSQFGTLQFNANYTSPADVGYMYHTRYTNNSKTMTNTETMFSSSSLETTYWYAHDVVWGTPIANTYNLDNPYQVSATTDYPNLVGEYTFVNAAQTYTNTTAQYITAVDNTTYYYIQLGNETGTTHDLSYYNYTYTYASVSNQGSPTKTGGNTWYASRTITSTNKPFRYSDTKAYFLRKPGALGFTTSATQSNVFNTYKENKVYYFISANL